MIRNRSRRGSTRAVLAAGVVVGLVSGCAGDSGRADMRTDDATSPREIRMTDQVSGTDALLIGVSAVSESVAWVAGTQGTWLRTTDGGATWSGGRVAGAEDLQFRDVHARDASTAWLLSIGNGADSRIYRTSDAGATWERQFIGVDPRGFYDCLDFWDDRRGIVIGDEVDGAVSMLETTDGGAAWTPIPATRLPSAQAGEGSFAASGTCLVAGPGGRAWIVASNPDLPRLLSTTDYGATWAVDTLAITVRAGVGPQSVAFHGATRVMVLQGGADSRPDDVGTVFSADGGATWLTRMRPPLEVGVWGSAYIPGTDPPTLMAVSPSGAVVTRDDGATWTVLDRNDYWSVGFASADAGWAVGRNGRITKLSGF